MEETKVELSPGMHKSAIIYRDDSARFIYVCYHCGINFHNITDTLQHIESHFEVVNITDDPAHSTDTNSIKLFDCPGIDPSAMEPVDFKIEILDSDDDYEFAENFFSTISDPMFESEKQYFRCKLCDSIYESKFLVRIHALRIHLGEHSFRCVYCSRKFKSNLYFENHLKMHVRQHDVDWQCITEGIQKPLNANWSAYEENVCDPSEGVKVDEVVVKHDETLDTNEKPKAAKRKRKKITQSKMFTRPFKCHKCPQVWRYVNELKNHFKTHGSDEILHLSKCKNCDVYFKNGFELRLHVLEIHLSVKTFNCTACSIRFKLHESKQFEEHLQLHKINDGVLWTNISEGVHHQSKDVMAYEENDSFTEELHPCEFCSQRFYIKDNLDVHMKYIHSSQRRLQCGQCGSIFTTPKYYFAHQLEHQRVGPNIIERDDNVLLANLNACIEERIIYDENEQNERSYRCLICNSQFEVPYDIRSHIRERHVYKMFPPPTEPKREFICDLCGMAMKSKAAVKNHLLIHTNTKSHPCTICGKKFRQNADRRIHERQHTGEKPFQCHECGKRFISKGLLTAHKKSHDDSTYPCTICGRVFNLPSGYRKHIQTHRVDRAFQCTVCSKSFNTRIYLTKHMSIHSEKLYQCRFCELKFNTGDGRRQHQRYKHNYSQA